jgi:hypothetical protein
MSASRRFSAGRSSVPPLRTRHRRSGRAPAPSPRRAGGDVGLAGLALRVERVELLVQPLVGGLPRVDRAAELLHLRRHGRSSGFGGSCATPPQPEERPAVPARAGDVPRDGGERLVGPPLDIRSRRAHRDDVLDALPFADQRVPAIGRLSARMRRRTTLPPSSCSPSASRRDASRASARHRRAPAPGTLSRLSR